MFQNFNLLEAITSLPGILIGFTFHEYAHAYTSARFGDPTPESQGRLTINPLAHIDVWGLLLIIFAGFGWAKPVQTNPSYYRGDVKKKDMIVSMAGPMTNLVIAIIVCIIILVISRLELLGTLDGAMASTVADILYNAAWINCVLFIFNLIPIPPLDGFHILSDLMPESSRNIIFTMDRYGYIILMVFILSPFSDVIIGNGARMVLRAILILLGMG